MSDTATQEATKRPFSVDYVLEIVDELPPGGVRGFGKSALETQLDRVKEGEANHGKWALIGRYKNSTAASAASNVLKQRHGRKPDADGWDFAVRPVGEKGERGLFVKYTPDQIREGAMAEHQKSEAKRKANLQEKRRERENGAGDNNGAAAKAAEKAPAAAKTK